MTATSIGGIPLRILHVLRSSEFAGVEQFVRRLAIAQAGEGHTVAVVGGDARLMREPLRSAGIGFRTARTTAEVMVAVRSNVRRVEVINAHMTAADIGAVVGRGISRADAAIVSTRHFAQQRGSTGPGLIYRRLERSIDAELSISQVVAAAIGVSSRIVPPGVARRERSAGRVGARSRRILIAQRLEAEKHTEVGIRAFIASGLNRDGWTLDIAGTGAQSSILRNLAESLDARDAVRFLGFRDDVPALMDESALLLATCPFEHFGLTVLESMASGLPVVAAAAGGHLEMLADLDARALFPPDDVAAAAESLRALAVDPRGRGRLGRAEQARQRERFSIEAQVRSTDAAYRAAIDARRARHARLDR